MKLQIFGQSKRDRTAAFVLKKPGKFIFMRDSKNTFSITAAHVENISSIRVEVSHKGQHVFAK